ncbi:MAG: hypothetical protein ACK553_03055 [Planctomycetota bacterium]|jgi:hypothetical protein
MKEILTAIERHLGRTISYQQLDYYQVIGLELYCDDAQAIRKALQDATNRWMQSETVQHAESAQLVAKLLKQAQAILLDSDKRERYNSQLRELRATQARSAEDVSHDTKTSSSLFPGSDPMAPFALESATSLASRPDSPCALLEQIQDPQTRLAELEQLFPSLAELDQPLATETELASVPVLSTRSKSVESHGASLAEQLRRKRKRRRVILSASFVAGSFAVLGLAVWAYLSNQSKTELKGKRTRDLAVRQTDRTAERREQMMPDLPQVPRAKDPTLSTLPALPEVNRSMDPEDPPARPSMPETEPKTEPPPAPMPTPEPEPPASNPPPPMVAAETAEWKKRMADARGALDREDFKTFEKEIALGLETAQTPLGRDQAARLDQLGQLFKIGTESFQESRKKARGTSSIKVGATEFSIVESTPEKLVVRSGGKNQTHPWDKLPFGIAIALFDLSLDASEPTDVAARAVYFSLAKPYREDAVKSEIMKKKIAGWFEKSAGQGGIRADLSQGLTDTYE